MLNIEYRPRMQGRSDHMIRECIRLRGTYVCYSAESAKSIKLKYPELNVIYPLNGSYVTMTIEILDEAS